MSLVKLHRIIGNFIASVWLLNGLFYKVLNFVPRHKFIVAGILGDQYSGPLTILIGVSEISMSIWVFTGFKSRLNAIVQMIIVGVMNLLEFILVPDLLLWGKMNSIFAALFILVVYFNEFYLNKRSFSHA